MATLHSIPWKTLLLTLWVSVAPLTVSSLVAYYALTHEATVASFGTIYWMLFFAASCLTMGLALTPTTFIALLSGYFLGWTALPGVIIGYTGASLIGFLLTYAIDGGQLLRSVYQWLGSKADRLRQLLSGIHDNQFGIIVMARLSPVLPFALMNVVLPVAGVRLVPFLVAGTSGMLPRTVFFVWLGSEAQALRTLVEEEGTAGIGPRLWLVGLLVVSLVGFFYYGRRVLFAGESRG